MKHVDTSSRSSTGVAFPRDDFRAKATPVFRCFLWLDIILPWIIVAWLALRYWRP